MTSNLTITLTGYTKTSANGEPLCKRIRIGPDGLPLADASVCKMSSGKAWHIELQGGLAGLVPLFTGMTSMQAISLGAIVPEHRPAAGETVLITTKKRYEALAAKGKLNRGARKTIARTKLLVTYAEGRPAALLFDFDTKGMPAAIRARIAAAGGVWNLLVEALPFLKDIERVERASTSAGLIPAAFRPSPRRRHRRAVPRVSAHCLEAEPDPEVRGNYVREVNVIEMLPGWAGHLARCVHRLLREIVSRPSNPVLPLVSPVRQLKRPQRLRKAIMLGRQARRLPSVQ